MMTDDDSDDAMRAGHELRGMIEQVEQAAEDEAHEEAAMRDTAEAISDCEFLQCTVLGKHGAVSDDATLRGRDVIFS